MPRNSNLAYLPQKEERKELQVRPAIEKVKHSKVLEYIHPHYVILFVGFVAAILCVLLFSMVQLNEVTSHIHQINEDLRIQQSEAVRLNTALESQSSLNSIEKYAQEKLGLQKMTANQVTYISLSQGNAIEIPQEGHANWIEGVKNGILKFLEYLAA